MLMFFAGDIISCVFGLYWLHRHRTIAPRFELTTFCPCSRRRCADFLPPTLLRSVRAESRVPRADARDGRPCRRDTIGDAGIAGTRPEGKRRRPPRRRSNSEGWRSRSHRPLGAGDGGERSAPSHPRAEQEAEQPVRHPPPADVGAGRSSAASAGSGSRGLDRGGGTVRISGPVRAGNAGGSRTN